MKNLPPTAKLRIPTSFIILSKTARQRPRRFSRGFRRCRMLEKDVADRRSFRKKSPSFSSFSASRYRVLRCSDFSSFFLRSFSPSYTRKNLIRLKAYQRSRLQTTTNLRRIVSLLLFFSLLYVYVVYF